MQRLLENHSGDQEFSQARLLDEDASMKNDLRTMKAGLSRKRQLSSGSSTFSGSGSNFNGSRRSTPPWTRRRRCGCAARNAASCCP